MFNIPTVFAIYSIPSVLPIIITTVQNHCEAVLS